ncbi:MAG TPA: NUDIX hydrolase [Candidatus Aveggerthella excrementigallinarum]|nr:NUDIX hydrolase [Candidatus Aveggerthella excrementigallinarum]
MEKFLQTPAFESMELVSSGWINKYVLTYRMPDGRTHVYESASRKKPEAYERELRAADAAQAAREAGASSAAVQPDALSIVGRTVDDEILLIREFRYPVNDWCVAFPAGLVEPGEDLAACADRELREETGYRVVRPADGSPAVCLMPQAGLSSTGMTDEQVQVCFARIERAGDAEPEENELIEPFTVPVSGLRRFLDENRNPIGTRCQLVLEMYAHAFPQDKDGGYL